MAVIQAAVIGEMNRRKRQEEDEERLRRLSQQQHHSLVRRIAANQSPASSAGPSTSRWGLDTTAPTSPIEQPQTMEQLIEFTRRQMPVRPLHHHPIHPHQQAQVEIPPLGEPRRPKKSRFMTVCGSLHVTLFVRISILVEITLASLFVAALVRLNRGHAFDRFGLTKFDPWSVTIVWLRVTSVSGVLYAFSLLNQFINVWCGLNHRLAVQLHMFVSIGVCLNALIYFGYVAATVLDQFPPSLAAVACAVSLVYGYHVRHLKLYSEYLRDGDDEPMSADRGLQRQYSFEARRDENGVIIRRSGSLDSTRGSLDPVLLAASVRRLRVENLDHPGLIDIENGPGDPSAALNLSTSSSSTNASRLTTTSTDGRVVAPPPYSSFYAPPITSATIPSGDEWSPPPNYSRRSTLVLDEN